MFNQDEFIKLLKYFKDGTESTLDIKTIISAENSKAKSATLFSENIDMQCFLTDDYKRLKELFIRWYAAHRTFVSTGKHASDVRSLPDSDVNELINSFGYSEELGEITSENKIDFFYDLVNLYKIKGTPEAVERVLGYFGISNVELVEYWLQYDSSKNLVFRPESLSNTDSLVKAQDLDFDDIATPDPHWMLTESQINQLFLTNKIAFPSKSPYFAIRPTNELSGGDLNPTLAILMRLVQDQYDSYISGSSPVKNIGFPFFNLNISLLDLYTGTVYAFNKIYNKTNDSSDLSSLYYTGSLNLTNAEIIAYYNTLSDRVNIKTREELEANKILYDSSFTKLRSTNFLTNLNTAGTVLNLTNPDFKTSIDYYFLISKEEEILNVLLKELTGWVQTNISSTTSNLLSIVFGFDSLDYLKRVVNFFKPYRSRLILVEHIFKIDNPLRDSVIPSDSFTETITDIFIDFDTGDSEPCYPEDFIPTGIYVTSTPPFDGKRVSELYLDSTGVVRCVYDDSTSNIEVSTVVRSNPSIGEFRVYNIYLDETIDGSKILVVISEETPDSSGGISTRVYSNPPQDFYQITDIYLNSLNQLTITYDSNINYPIDSTARVYYSRLITDCGSYFDIGASCDDPAREPDIFIDQSIFDIYNSHVGDGTSSVHFEYILDSTSTEVIDVITVGGWETFDNYWMFDAPAFSDICHIQVTDF